MHEVNTKISKKLSQTFKRTQFPLTLSEACTVQKVQGLTLSRIVLSMELVKQRTFSPGQIYVALSQSASLSKSDILSKFDPIIIKLNHLALNHYEYLRKEYNLFTATFSEKKSFVGLLNLREMLTNISNLMGDSILMNVPLVCLTETQISSTTVLRDISSTDEIVRNDDQFHSTWQYLKAWQYFIQNTILKV